MIHPLRKKRAAGAASQGNYSVVPAGVAHALVAAVQGEEARALEQAASASQGQQSGVPGFGEAPSLFHQPGGDLLSGLQHPAFTTFERLRRKLPEEGWFSPNVDPRHPIQFAIDAFTVPKGMALWLFDYEFSVYRPSGVDPGDFIRAENGRFSNQLGFDINISGRRPNNLSYQLDPSPVTLDRPGFEAPIGSSPIGAGPAATGAFDRSSANSFAASTNAGTSLLPARPNVQGARDKPFAFIVGEGAVVQLNCVIFNTIRAPLAAIEGRQAGYLIHTNTSTALLQRVRPR